MARELSASSSEEQIVFRSYETRGLQPVSRALAAKIDAPRGRDLSLERRAER